MKQIAVFCRIALRLFGAALCGATCAAHADSRCGNWDAKTIRFLETVQQHAPKTAAGGEFLVKPFEAEGKRKFDVRYRAGGTERFRVNIVPNTQSGEEFNVVPFRSRGTGALFVTVGFGGSDGFQCGYLIHINAGIFRFEKIEGNFKASDVDRDGLDEIVTYELQSWADRCDTRIAWRRIFRLDRSGSKLVDASNAYANYYADLERNYRQDKAAYEKSATPVDSQCSKAFDAILKRANSIAGARIAQVPATVKLPELPAEHAAAANPVASQQPATQWRVLKVGQSGNGVSFRKVGDDATAFFDKTPIAKCVNGSNFRGERRSYLKSEMAVAEVHVSPLSPTGQYLAVFCGSENSSAGAIHLIMPRTGSVFSPLPRELFLVLDPWVSFSPDDRYAVLNQSGDEGNYSALVLNLSTRRAAKLAAPLFPHDEKSGPVWLTDRTVKYRVGQICDDNRDPCRSLGVYDYEVDISSMAVKRKRVGDWRP